MHRMHNTHPIESVITTIGVVPPLGVALHSVNKTFVAIKINHYTR